MDKTPTDTSTGAPFLSTTTAAEERTLRDVVYNSKRCGGNYGSLSKSQTQPTFYIAHKVESNDTFQRLALKYSINVQEIKRVNKLWSDAELSLREHVHIPVNTIQLTALQNLYPDLEIDQSFSPSTNHHQKTSATDDETAATLPSSDSSTSIQSTTNNASYQDYLSKIDQQIQQTKSSLKSLDIKETYRAPTSNNDGTDSPQHNRSSVSSNERHKGAHHLSDNSVFVDIPSKTSRDKHVSAALKRIQQERDNSDEL